MPYTIVPTDSGLLRGMDSAAVVSLLGVPYGATTGGANRFRAPQPVEPWSGVRDALAFGPSAPQVDTRTHAAANGPRMLSLLYPRGGWPVEGGTIDEDCLRLNIWAPSARQDDALPVLVWLHGGGFTHGSGNEMVFNGDELARFGDLVVVSVTHRLGITGFLDLRDEGFPDSANAGMLDIVAALDWVRRNIASVGGDPANVTVCGQSGGSAKVGTLQAIPAARGLFARSIMMSGPFAILPPQEHSAQTRRRALAALGEPAIGELQSIPLERLLDAQAGMLGFGVTRFGATPVEQLLGFGPSLDEVHAPRQPFHREDGTAELVGDQLMIGWTAHEAGLLLVDEPEYTTRMTRDQVARLIEEDEPGQGAAAYDALAAEFPAEPPHLLWSRRISARVMRDPAVEIADAVAPTAGNVWVYQFDQTTEVLDGLLGSCHSLELAYVFGTVDRIPLTGRDPARVETSRRMMGAWSAFARSGNPADGEDGWHPWTREDRDVHHFGRPLGAGVSPAAADFGAPVKSIPA
ncbi:carboxylesterase/lipase family protein [Leifsonia poae]|uniref:carboxylesterase/lipase family protein n=1 Tax=Leifsonia poae TaxID=110933 RepID=UPI001CBC166D|nr:carboxylesterase family protein [Leifsonia poae]